MITTIKPERPTHITPRYFPSLKRILSLECVKFKQAVQTNGSVHLTDRILAERFPHSGDGYI